MKRRILGKPINTQRDWRRVLKKPIKTQNEWRALGEYKKSEAKAIEAFREAKKSGDFSTQIEEDERFIANGREKIRQKIKLSHQALREGDRQRAERLLSEIIHEKIELTMDDIHLAELKIVSAKPGEIRPHIEAKTALYAELDKLIKQREDRYK